MTSAMLAAGQAITRAIVAEGLSADEALVLLTYMAAGMAVAVGYTDEGAAEHMRDAVEAVRAEQHREGGAA